MSDQLDRLVARLKAWKPPEPDEERAYIIGAVPPQVRVVIKGVPPCLWCGEPVYHLSMDGPLVCGSCDMGCNKDGSRWTSEEYIARCEHFRKSVEEYRCKPDTVCTPAKLTLV